MSKCWQKSARTNRNIVENVTSTVQTVSYRSSLISAVGLLKIPCSSSCVLVLSSSTPKMGNFFWFGRRSAMIWDQSKPGAFLVPIKYHHYHIKWAISCCQGNFSAEFSSCKHNFPKIIFWLIRSMRDALSLPVYTDFFNISQWEMIWNKPF